MTIWWFCGDTNEWVHIAMVNIFYLKVKMIKNMNSSVPLLLHILTNLDLIGNKEEQCKKTSNGKIIKILLHALVELECLSTVQSYSF